MARCLTRRCSACFAASGRSEPDRSRGGDSRVAQAPAHDGGRAWLERQAGIPPSVPLIGIVLVPLRILAVPMGFVWVARHNASLLRAKALLG